jgi:hypothetical protein
MDTSVFQPSGLHGVACLLEAGRDPLSQAHFHLWILLVGYLVGVNPEIISMLRRRYLARFSKTSFTTGRAENAFGQPA